MPHVPLRDLPDLSAEAGFSLLEMLVASLISILVVGGVLIMLDGIQQVHRDTQELIDAQQMARLGLAQMQRDVQLAGVGLGWMLSPLPFLAPRDDGGILIRHNQGGVTTTLATDMTTPGSAIVVEDTTGFEAGMQVAIYDSTGSIDMVAVTAVNSSASSLSHSGATKAYTVADGSAVARILTINYLVQTINGVPILMRQEDTGLPQPVANGVRTLTFTYYDDSLPPQVFNPVTVADQLRIRTVEILLVVETENVKLNTDQQRTVTLTTRVTPRAVVLS